MILEMADELEEQYKYQEIHDLLEEASVVLAGNSDFDEMYHRYHGYSANLLCFCPIVNSASYEVEDAIDINGNQYEYVIKAQHSTSKKILEFRMPEGFTVLSGVLFICQDENYQYDQSVTGTSAVTFKDDSGQIIGQYSGIDFKHAVPFEVPISGIDFLTIEVERDSYRTVVLGIRDAVMR